MIYIILPTSTLRQYSSYIISCHSGRIYMPAPLYLSLGLPSTVFCYLFGCFPHMTFLPIPCIFFNLKPAKEHEAPLHHLFPQVILFPLHALLLVQVIFVTLLSVAPVKVILFAFLTECITPEAWPKNKVSP